MTEHAVVADMVTFLITSLFILAFLAIAIYFWQKPVAATETERLLPPPGRGLFIDGTGDGEAVALAKAEADSEAASARRQSSLSVPW